MFYIKQSDLWTSNSNANGYVPVRYHIKRSPFITLCYSLMSQVLLFYNSSFIFCSAGCLWDPSEDLLYYCISFSSVKAHSCFVLIQRIYLIKYTLLLFHIVIIKCCLSLCCFWYLTRSLILFGKCNTFMHIHVSWK